MKKILSIIISAIIVLSCVGTTAFAGEIVYNDFKTSDHTYGEIKLDRDYTARLSENLHTLYVDDNILVPIDASNLDYNYYWMPMDSAGDILTFELTEQQQKDILEIRVACSVGLLIWELHIDYNNGSSYKLSYIQQGYYADYERVMAGEGDQMIVDFEYPEDNTVCAEKSDFYTEPVIIFDVGIKSINWYKVEISSGPVCKAIGGICIGDQGKYYFCDSAENGTDGYWNENCYTNFAQLKVHEITNPQVIADLDEGLESFYDDDYGFLYNKEETSKTSIALLIIFFIALPVLVFVIFTVLAIKSKTKYRVLFMVVALGALIELIILAIVAAMLNYY